MINKTTIVLLGLIISTLITKGTKATTIFEIVQNNDHASNSNTSNTSKSNTPKNDKAKDNKTLEAQIDSSSIEQTPTQESLQIQRNAQKRYALSEKQLRNIELGIQYLKAKSSETNYLTLFLNFLSVLGGAILGGILSLVLHKRQNKFEINKSLMDWKVAQLQELYGPLNALMHQSNTLYRLMNEVLLKADPNMFRLRHDAENSDFDNKLFEIKEHDSWDVFRTVIHIELVYGKNFGIECYFDEIVSIGDRMVTVIEKSAGYVREDQPELANIFGKYLAHFKILKELHSRTLEKLKFPSKNSETPHRSTIALDKSAAFPYEIQGLIQSGYNSLINDLNKWGKQGDMV